MVSTPISAAAFAAARITSIVAAPCLLIFSFYCCVRNMSYVIPSEELRRTVKVIIALERLVNQNSDNPISWDRVLFKEYMQLHRYSIEPQV
ncbi:hypothetical protein OROMI_022309 [Orobanche minor]